MAEPQQPARDGVQDGRGRGEPAREARAPGVVDVRGLVASAGLLPDGVLVVDDRGVIVGVNDRAERLLGRAPGELAGCAIDDLGLRDARGCSWSSLVDPAGGLATRTGHPELMLDLPDGRQLLVTGRFLRDAASHPVRAVVLSLRDTRARQRLDRDAAALVTTIAHELRSPLKSVKGFTATLLGAGDEFTEPERRVLLAAVAADAERLSRLITDLLDISRLEAGRLRLRRRRADLREPVRGQVARQVAAGVAAERLTVDVPQDPVEADVDPDRVEQILTNLVTNALTHGAGRVDIVVRQPDPAWVELVVSDHGPGIPERLRPATFTRFWRGRDSNGTGLGLYLVRGLVAAHTGSVTIETAPGGGALVRVLLPTKAHGDSA